MAINVEQLRSDIKTLSKEELNKKYEELKGLSDEEIEKVAGGAMTTRNGIVYYNRFGSK